MDLNDWDEEAKQRLFDSFFGNWITPEVERRHAAGDLALPLDLFAAQVVLFPDARPPLVRLNTEVKAIATSQYKPGITKAAGDVVYEDDIEGVEDIKLSDEDDPDCGHATLLRIKVKWYLNFDFRLNKGMARQHILSASHFYETAAFAVDRGYWEVATDTLFSAAELLARANLLSFSGSQFRKKTTHTDTQIKYNRFVDLGNDSPDHKSAFNRLSGLRMSARYLKGEAEIDQDEIRSLLAVVEEMLADASQIAAD